MRTNAHGNRLSQKFTLFISMDDCVKQEKKLILAP